MIKEYRKLKKISQAKLGKLVGVPRTTVGWCERNEHIKQSQAMVDIKNYIKHSKAYDEIAKIYSRPAVIETKPKISFFARLLMWLKY